MDDGNFGFIRSDLLQRIAAAVTRRGFELHLQLLANPTGEGALLRCPAPRAVPTPRGPRRGGLLTCHGCASSSPTFVPEGETETEGETVGEEAALHSQKKMEKTSFNGSVGASLKICPDQRNGIMGARRITRKGHFMTRITPRI